MKKLLIVFMTLITILTLNVNVFADTTINFTDTKGHWAEKDILELASKGIVNGVGNNKFSPNTTIMVDEFIKLCITAVGIEYDTQKYSYWAMPYINKAISLGIVGNKEFDYFSRAITREEMASILIKSYGTIDTITASNLNNEIINSIGDYSLINDYYKDSVLKCYNVGLMKGNNGLFNPKKTATRAEAVAVIMRILKPENRTPFTFDAPYTMATYSEWTDSMGWSDVQVKVYAPKNEKGQYVTEALDLYNSLVKNQLKDVSYYDVHYNYQGNQLGSSFAPFKFEKYNSLGANSKAYNTNMGFDIKLLEFGKKNSFPYQLTIFSNKTSTGNSKYFEFLESNYSLFLNDFFNVLFGNEGKSLREEIRKIINADNGSDLVEKTLNVNGRIVMISSKNGMTIRISDKLN